MQVFNEKLGDPIALKYFALCVLELYSRKSSRFAIVIVVEQKWLLFGWFVLCVCICPCKMRISNRFLAKYGNIYHAF